MAKIFIVFHNKINDYYQEIHEINKQYLTLYGVHSQIPHETGISSLYESELPIYNPILQERRYNEGSCLYHIYKNELYPVDSYIGFLQYDMKFTNDVFDIIRSKMSDHNISYIFAPFFAVHDSIERLDGSLQFMINPITNFGSALENYNQFFNKTYTIMDVKQNPFIMCNTYIIPTKIYTKMMLWMENLFSCEINQQELEELYSRNPGIFNGSEISINDINPGHLVEAFAAMFLSLEMLEGAKIVHLKMEHVR